jgi:hypothetical protein
MTCTTSLGTPGGMPTVAGSTAVPESSVKFRTNSIRSYGTIRR